MNRMTNKHIRLLVVDDELSLREIVTATLEESGYDVAAANDGLDALKKLEEFIPDMIISDLQMPRMSGIEFLAIVRRRFPCVPVIATSGEFCAGELPAEVLADAYLEKGAYTAMQLCATITGLLAVSPIQSRLGAISATY